MPSTRAGSSICILFPVYLFWYPFLRQSHRRVFDSLTQVIKEGASGSQMVNKSNILSLILYNESCERFCLYGLRMLLFLFLRTDFQLSYISSLLIVHGFISLTYTAPVFLGMMLESFYGKYNAIVNLSIVYLFGAITLTIAALYKCNVGCLITGLVLLSLGMGGLKPCVSFHRVETNEPIMDPSPVFRIIYFVVYGSTLLSCVWAPILADIGCIGRQRCYFFPFAVASLILCAAIILFHSGSKYFEYEKIPNGQYKTAIKNWLLSLSARIKGLDSRSPQRAASSPHGPAGSSLPLYEQPALSLKPIQAAGSEQRAIVALADRNCTTRHPSEEELSKLLGLFAPSIVFWCLVDQQYTNWIEQGLKMKSSMVNEIREVSGKILMVNSLMMILIVPIITALILCLMKIFRFRRGSLRNMAYAVGLASLGFFLAAFLEYEIIRLPFRLSILWQLPQYFFISLAELVMAMSGFKSLYNPLPHPTRGLVLLLWLSCIGLSNIIVAGVSLLLAYIKPIAPIAHLLTYMLFGGLGLLSAYNMYYKVAEL